MQQIGAFDGDGYANFNQWSSFLDHVLVPKYHGYRWFAHNGGRFDSNAMFDWIRENRPNLQMSFYCVGSCVVSLTLHKGEHYWRFCDSYRLMDASLYQLTREFQVEHLKHENPDYASVAYNRDDCLGLYEVLTKFFGEFNETAETVAAFALKVWRGHFQKGRLRKPPRNVEDFVRSSYYGGRCEVYRWDEAILDKYDVNSLYPSVMLNPVPVEYIGRCRRLLDNDDEKMGFYRAIVDYPDIYLPALPALLADRLFFPVGHFEGDFTSFELRKAIGQGAAIRIIDGALFRTEPIFRDFVEALYRMRLEAKAAGNAARDYTCKKISNSFYGKFGQRRVQRSYLIDPGTPRLDMMDPKSPQLWPIGLDTGIAYYDRESHAGHILPHISSAITSRARLKTLDYLQSTEKVWYTDTDSVFTDSKLPTGPNLGELKLEGNGRFMPFGLKEYRFDGHYNVKGVSVYVTDPLTGKKHQDISAAEWYLSGGEISYERRAGFLESLRDGQKTFRSVTRTKKRNPRIEKRARNGAADTRAWRAQEIEAML